MFQFCVLPTHISEPDILQKEKKLTLGNELRSKPRHTLDAEGKVSMDTASYNYCEQHNSYMILYVIQYKIQEQ